MNIETLNIRINNAKTKITKIEGTLDRHNKLLEKIKGKIVSIDKNFNFETDLEKDHRHNWDLHSLVYDYEYKLRDIKNNETKLNEAKRDLEKYENILQVELKKKDDINNVIPQCLIDFLENWKRIAKEYYLKLCGEYIEVCNKDYEVTREELEAITHVEKNWRENTSKVVRSFPDEKIEELLSSDESSYKYRNAKSSIKYHHKMKFRERHFASEMAIVDKIVSYEEIIHEDILDKILDFDVQCKKESFMQRVMAVVGVVEDMSDFDIANNGEINGIAIGSKCRARVETITAGGYNIQCLHYRVLVNKIK